MTPDIINKRTTFRLPPPWIARLDEIAGQEGTTIARLVRVALQSHYQLDAYRDGRYRAGRKPKRTREAVTRL